MNYLIGSPGDVGDFIGTTVIGSQTYNKVIHACMALPSAAEVGERGFKPCNMLLLFAYRNPLSFWFAGFDFSGELSDSYGTGLIIGRYSGGLHFPEVHLAIDGAFELGERHRLELAVNQVGSVVELDLSDATDPAWTVHAESTVDYVYNGRVGVGAYGGSVNVYNFGINCPGMVC